MIEDVTIYPTKEKKKEKKKESVAVCVFERRHKGDNQSEFLIGEKDREIERESTMECVCAYVQLRKITLHVLVCVCVQYNDQREGCWHHCGNFHNSSHLRY